VTAWVRGQERSIEFVSQAIRTVGFAMSVPIGVAIGMSQPTLRLWLGEGFARWWFLSAPLLLPLAGYYALSSVGALLRAMNEVRLPSRTMLVCGGLSAAAGAICAGPLGLGPMSVAVCGGAGLVIQKAVIEPTYAARRAGVKRSAFAWGGWAGMGMATAMAIGTRAAAPCLRPHGWLSLLTFALSSATLGYLIASRLLLRSNDRALLLRLAAKGWSRRTTSGRGCDDDCG